MQVVVLKTFILKIKEEHEAQLSKRTKKKSMKVSKDHDYGLEAPSGPTIKWNLRWYDLYI